MTIPSEEKIGGLRWDESRYENVYGTCSECSANLVVNRATDLGNALPADGSTFRCSQCGTLLKLYGDTANHPIDLLLDEVAYLIHDRLYMYCALVLCQAVEMTLWVCAARVLVVDASPVAPASELAAEFERKLSKMTLDSLRNLVAKLAVHSIRPVTVEDAKRWLAEAGNLARDAPSDELVEQIADEHLREAIKKLRSLTIGTLRNSVAHKYGVRPTEEQIIRQEPEVRGAVKALLRAHGFLGQLIVFPRVVTGEDPPSDTAA